MLFTVEFWEVPSGARTEGTVATDATARDDSGKPERESSGTMENM